MKDSIMKTLKQWKKKLRKTLEDKDLLCLQIVKINIVKSYLKHSTEIHCNPNQISSDILHHNRGGKSVF